MPKPAEMEFFIDPSRCIGCQACVQACTECDTHKGQSMIQLDTGRPLAGPPKRPLARVILEIRDGNVVATGIEKRTA